jgi:hypothetical protein
MRKFSVSLAFPSCTPIFLGFVDAYSLEGAAWALGLAPSGTPGHHKFDTSWRRGEIIIEDPQQLTCKQDLIDAAEKLRK